MLLPYLGRGCDYRSNVRPWLTSGFACSKLAPHAHMRGIGIETFRPKVVWRVGCIVLGNVFGVELPEVFQGLLSERWPD